MALTAAQRETVFEILNIPSFDRIGLMVDPDNLATFAIDYGDSAKRTSAYVDGILNLIASTYPAKEAMLLDYIDKWDTISTDPAKQENGAVGNLTGFTDDPTVELKIIRGRVERIIGIRRWNESMEVTRAPSTIFRGVTAG
jgi:hypothetical protein